MAAEQNIPVIVNRLHLHARIAQQIGEVAASRSPKRIVDHLEARLGDSLQIHQLGQPLQEGRLHVGSFESVFWRIRCGNARPARAQSRNRRFNLLGCLRQSGRPVGSRILDAVILRRIVRSGKVDGPRGLQSAHGIGDGRCRRGFRNHNRRNPGPGQHPRRLGHKALPQKSRIAPHQYPGSPGSGLCFLGWQQTVRLRLRLHIRGNPRHRQPDIGHRKPVSHNRPPPRSAKPDRCTHRFSTPLSVSPSSTSAYRPAHSRATIHTQRRILVAGL